MRLPLHTLSRVALALCAALLLAASALAAEAGTYVVLPFKVNGPAGFSYLEKAVPSMLASRLYWKDHAEPVDDAAAARGGRVSSSAGLDKARAAAGADYAVWGEVSIVGDNAVMDVLVRGPEGREWRKNVKSPVNDLIASLQDVADSINADLFGRPVTASAANARSASMVNQMNPDLMHNETTQRQVYLNPQLRYQGNDGTRLRSQNLPFASVGMEVADLDGDGRNEVALLSKDRVHVYRWSEQGLKPLGEHKLPSNLTPMLLRSIDLNRDGSAELVVSTYDPDYTQPRSFLFSYRDGKFVTLADRLPYYLNVVRMPPDFMPVLVGQKGDPSRIFSRAGVHEMIPQGKSMSTARRLDLPEGANALNFAWLPGKPGEDTNKIVLLTGEEKLRVFTPQGASLYQSDESFSGSAIGIAEQTTMPGLGKSDVLIPSKYFVPLRMIPTDLEKDGVWELLVNKPLSVAAQFFENYRNFPESEIHALFWDGVGLSLLWKTRRIKGSVADFALSDVDNNGVPDLIAAVNTHPGALGLQNRKTIVIAYPLDLSQADPKTAPALE